MAVVPAHILKDVYAEKSISRDPASPEGEVIPSHLLPERLGPGLYTCQPSLRLKTRPGRRRTSNISSYKNKIIRFHFIYVANLPKLREGKYPSRGGGNIACYFFSHPLCFKSIGTTKSCQHQHPGNVKFGRHVHIGHLIPNDK
ncbi:MAG: hypothetical protein KCHDKBKB_00157 [Elusimicrobia bacterium]|nr:hypothetical protein [Elusimicrobiota bacterium]